MPLSLFLLVVILHSGALSSGWASSPVHPRGVDDMNMLGIPLPDGFEPTRDASESVYLLQTMCGASYEGLGFRDRPATPSELVERFDFRDAPGAPEQLMETVTALLLDAGYRVQFVFDQFLEDRGIVIVTVFSPSGEDGYYLLFDYEKRLFHPVGPCPTRPRNELPGAP